MKESRYSVIVRLTGQLMTHQIEWYRFDMAKKHHAGAGC